MTTQPGDRSPGDNAIVIAQHQLIFSVSEMRRALLKIRYAVDDAVKALDEGGLPNHEVGQAGRIFQEALDTTKLLCQVLGPIGDENLQGYLKDGR